MVSVEMLLTMWRYGMAFAENKTMDLEHIYLELVSGDPVGIGSGNGMVPDGQAISWTRGLIVVEWSHSAFTSQALLHHKWHMKVKRPQTLSCCSQNGHCCIMAIVVTSFWGCAESEQCCPGGHREVGGIISYEIPDLWHGSFRSPRAFPR